jgi:C-terminal processing protease CtpA/Prc
MKITVDIEEFWIDSDSGKISDGLRDYVSHTVVKEIYAEIGEQINLEITKQCTEIIKTQINAIISKELEELVEKETIIYNRKEVKISDHIKEVFQNNTGWNNPNDVIKKIADRFGDELKMQYNKVFATHIVVALKNQGMLKDDVAQMLLEQPSQLK